MAFKEQLTIEEEICENHSELDDIQTILNYLILVLSIDNAGIV